MKSAQIKNVRESSNGVVRAMLIDKSTLIGDDADRAMFIFLLSIRPRPAICVGLCIICGASLFSVVAVARGELQRRLSVYVPVEITELIRSLVVCRASSLDRNNVFQHVHRYRVLRWG